MGILKKMWGSVKERKCPKCHGSGKYGFFTCIRCNGSGWVKD